MDLFFCCGLSPPFRNISNFSQWFFYSRSNPYFRSIVFLSFDLFLITNDCSLAVTILLLSRRVVSCILFWITSERSGNYSIFGLSLWGGNIKISSIIVFHVVLDDWMLICGTFLLTWVETYVDLIVKWDIFLSLYLFSWWGLCFLPRVIYNLASWYVVASLSKWSLFPINSMFMSSFVFSCDCGLTTTKLISGDKVLSVDFVHLLLGETLFYLGT